VSTQPAPATCVVPPSGGRILRAFGDEITVHLGAEETVGRYTMFTEVTPPGGGPPPHYHANEDEWFYVLEGRAEFLKDGAWIEARAGAVIFTPRGVVHTFRNAGDGPLRMLIHTSPSGFETFFARCAEEFARPVPPDLSRIAHIAAEHGIHFSNT